MDILLTWRNIFLMTIAWVLLFLNNLIISIIKHIKLLLGYIFLYPVVYIIIITIFTYPVIRKEDNTFMLDYGWQAAKLVYAYMGNILLYGALLLVAVGICYIFFCWVPIKAKIVNYFTGRFPTALGSYYRFYSKMLEEKFVYIASNSKVSLKPSLGLKILQIFAYFPIYLFTLFYYIVTLPIRLLKRKESTIIATILLFLIFGFVIPIWRPTNSLNLLDAIRAFTDGGWLAVLETGYLTGSNTAGITARTLLYMVEIIINCLLPAIFVSIFLNKMSSCVAYEYGNIWVDIYIKTMHGALDQKIALQSIQNKKKLWLSLIIPIVIYIMIAVGVWTILN